MFIPQYLRDIQKQPHNLVPLPPVPIFPPKSYHQTFLIPKLIDELNNPPSVTLLSVAPPNIAPPLKFDTYHPHWSCLLGWELDSLASDKEQIVLWKTGINIAVWDQAEFALFVPGIRENYPRLEIGDLVHMREVLPQQQQGSGLAFEGRVVALRKREGFVRALFCVLLTEPPTKPCPIDIFCSTLKHHVQTFLTQITRSSDGQPIFTPDDSLPLAFNVSFMVNARPLFDMEAAVATLDRAVTARFGTHNLARHWLFPNPEDLESPLSAYVVDRDFQDKDWVDKGLNSEQRVSILSQP